MKLSPLMAVLLLCGGSAGMARAALPPAPPKSINARPPAPPAPPDDEPAVNSTVPDFPIPDTQAPQAPAGAEKPSPPEPPTPAEPTEPGAPGDRDHAPSGATADAAAPGAQAQAGQAGDAALQFRNFLMLNDIAASSELDAALAAWPPAGEAGPWQQLAKLSAQQHLPVAARKLKLSELAARGGIALLATKAGGCLLLEALGDRYAYVQSGHEYTLMPLSELNIVYEGHALVATPQVASTRLAIADAARRAQSQVVSTDNEIDDTFVLTNTSRVPIDVAVDSTSCGCTAATLSAPTIAPHSSIQLNVSIRTDDERTVSVSLRSSDRAWKHPVVALRVRPPAAGLAAPPLTRITAHRGAGAETATLFSLPATIKIRKLHPSQKWLSARLSVLSRGNGQVGYALSVQLDKSAPPGHSWQSVQLDLQNAPIQALLATVEVDVQDDITVEPRAIALGGVARGSVAKATVIVAGAPGNVFSVQAQASDPGITIKADPTVRAYAQAVEVDVPITGTVGSPVQGSVTLKLSNGRQFVVPIAGSVLPAGTLVLPPLQVGQVAPDFTVGDATGQVWHLAALRGRKNVLLTFFPRCFTGGCATHLSSLRDRQAQFDAADVQILAVSVDLALGDAGQLAFAAQWNLSFPLIPDTQRLLSLLYGAAQNNTQMATRRTVFIDKQGIIRFIDDDVHVRTHGDDVLAHMRALHID